LHHAGLPDVEAAALASGWWANSRASFINGRAKCEGFAPVQPGDVLQLAGLGARFNGKVLCTGVRHDIDPSQGWKVHLQFGGLQQDQALQQRLQASRATRLLAPVSGLQLGVVTDNEDPQGNFRVRVKLPLVADDDGVWARVACLDAGSDRGLLIRPEIGDEVVLGFLDEDPRAPVLLGMLHSSAHAAPLAPSNDNHEKGFISRSGMRWLFDDDKKVMTLSTPAGNSLVLSEDEQAITLKDQHGNSVTLDAEGITLNSSKALTLKAATESNFEAGTSFGIKAVNLSLEASASAELKGGATATLKGGMVQIN
ncbi:MAG: phage baseplate assembly protein V, partial [Rubrivivax sp.]|nr:phage baseplate assembly protein V [Rubrivivax sp.]